MFGAWSGKRVMRERIMLRVVVPLEKREINDPCECHYVSVFRIGTDIEFVSAKLLHCFGMRKDGKRLLPDFLSYRFGHIGHKALNQIKDIALLHKCHLEVYLGMLKLAVSAKVFIAHCAGELVVTLEAGKHKDL